MLQKQGFFSTLFLYRTQVIIISSVGELIQVSVSIGVAIGAESWLELLEKADQSLLKAKAKGKNVVEG
jgi:PleD family two-component response regulator